MRKQPAAPAAQRGSPGSFGCVQFEFGFLLGPPDGRYMVREPAEVEPGAVLVLGTLGAPERRRLRDRRPRPLDEPAGPEPVPTTRATVVRPEPFPEREDAAIWLATLRRDDETRAAEVERALRVLNRALRAQRAAAADPYVGELSADRALVVRLGYGDGEAVVDGLFGEALELPRSGTRVKRSMEAPEERFAAILGGREQVLVAEELVLRARADVDAGCRREAALQARVALEALLAETEDGSLAEQRAPVIEAAASALEGEPGAGLEAALETMERVLRRHRLRGS